jgi:hypothetical protein
MSGTPRFELQDPKIRALIRTSNKQYLAGKSRPATESLKALRQEEAKKARRRSKS